MKIWNEVWDYVKMFVIVIVVVLVVNNVVLINAKIPSESMEQTIMTGDRIFGFRMAYGINFDFFGKHISKKMKDPERYDIIIFKYPDDETEWFIKRVIALPGETVLVKDGKVYINGSKKALSEPYIKEEPVEDFGPYKVPKNGYFVMGDNRNNSNDAREWETHYVSRDEVLGKAWFRYYPSIKVIK